MQDRERPSPKYLALLEDTACCDIARSRADFGHQRFRAHPKTLCMQSVF
jgi:hypothetical protein